MLGSLIDGVAGLLGYFIGSLASSIRNTFVRKLMPVNAIVTERDDRTTARVAQTPSLSLDTLDPIGKRLSNYELSMTRVIPLEGGLGQITLSIFERQRRFQCRVNLTDRGLVKQIGFAIHKFPSMEVPTDIDLTVLEYAHAKAVSETEKFLNDNLAGVATLPGPAKPVTTMSVEKISAPVAVPVSEPEVAEPKQTAKGTERVAVKAKLQSDNPKRVKYIGRFVKSGIGPRHKTNAATKEREYFDQFFVEIEDASLHDALNQVWGTDLERALESAGVKQGDLIEITNHGRTPVDISTAKPGEKAYKIRYEIRKL
jgi:hypothetical protein